MKKYMKKSVFTAPILVLVIALLSLFAKKVLAGAEYENEDMLFLAYTVLELLVFVLPGIFYIKLKPRGYTSEMQLVSFGFSQLPLTVLMFFVLAFGGILLSFLYSAWGLNNLDSSLTESIRILSDGEYITDTKDILYLSLAVAVVPAFAEEFVFRGILLEEYRKYGMLPAVTVTSLLFALLHFDAKLFLFYFLAGMALGMTAYTARSSLASGILHCLYNLFALFIQPLVTNLITIEAGSVMIFYLVTVFFLLFLMLSLGEAERLFAGYSTAGLRSKKIKPEPGRMIPPSFEILSPTLLLCILLFVADSLNILKFS